VQEAPASDGTSDTARQAGSCFRSLRRRNNHEVHLDQQLLGLLALTTCAGWLMAEAGVVKNLLERRRDRGVCPSCGRRVDVCRCG
jgi:hypothetical protein